jgi:hypothetical protein
MTEPVEQGINQTKRSLRHGLISALLALAGLGGVAVAGMFKKIPWIGSLGGSAFILLELMAFYAALIGAIRAARRPTSAGDRALLILGGGLSLVLIAQVVDSIRPHGHRAEMIAQQTEATDLETLGRAMTAYSLAHDGRYPTPEKWCDLLLRDANDPSVEVVRCLGGKERRCRYAMNPLADSCSAPDVVLLFECREGWNRFGGPEILTARWQRGKSCTVLFVNGQVEFIEADKVPLLRWEGKATGIGQQAAPMPQGQPQHP